MSASAIYAGAVVHTRFKPVRHRFGYRMPWMLLDIDELPALSRGLRLFSVNCANLFAFHDCDHGAGVDAPLRPQIEHQMRRAGIEPDGGPLRVLCMPRVAGLVFNPLSVFFCHRIDGSLAALLYEVNNTFGQRHGYFIPVRPPASSTVHQGCAKRFHVSPFMDMAMTYRFRVSVPGARASVAIDVLDNDDRILSAAFAGRRLPLTDGNLLRAFLRHPILAFQVLGAIHWEALRLWRKGVRARKLPTPPAEPVSIMSAEPYP
jgi:DUF1365 family protein